MTEQYREAPPYRQRARPISLDRFHRFLYHRAGPTHRLEVHQRKMADEFGCSSWLINKMMSKMTAQGRALIVGHAFQRVNVYQVADPDRWKLDDPSTHARDELPAPQWG